MLVKSIADVGKDWTETQTELEDPQMQNEEFTAESFSGRPEELAFTWVYSFGDGLHDSLPLGARREVRRLRRSVAMIRLLVGLTLGPQLMCAMLDCKMLMTDIPWSCSSLGD